MPKFTFSAALCACLLAVAPVRATARDYTVGTLKIGHPWSRPTPPGAPTGAGYLSVTNTGAAPDRLVGGTSPAVAAVEVHEMSMTGGVMKMRPVEGGLVIGPGKTVALAPSGYHLMLIGPKRPFKLGDHIPVTLQFAKAGAVTVDFEVQTASPGDDHSGMKM